MNNWDQLCTKPHVQWVGLGLLQLSTSGVALVPDRCPVTTSSTYWMTPRTSQQEAVLCPTSSYVPSRPSWTRGKLPFPSLQAAPILPHRWNPPTPGPSGQLSSFLMGKCSNRCFLALCGGWKSAYWGANIVSWKLCHVDYNPNVFLKAILPWFGRGYISIWNYFGNSLPPASKQGEQLQRLEDMPQHDSVPQVQGHHHKAVLCSSSQMFITMNSNKQTIIVSWWKVWWFIKATLNYKPDL